MNHSCGIFGYTKAMMLINGKGTHTTEAIPCDFVSQWNNANIVNKWQTRNASKVKETTSAEMWLSYEDWDL